MNDDVACSVDQLGIVLFLRIKQIVENENHKTQADYMKTHLLIEIISFFFLQSAGEIYASKCSTSNTRNFFLLIWVVLAYWENKQMPNEIN